MASVSCKDAIQMPALGQPFKLGMLYDCRTEKLIPGVTLWDNEDLKRDLVCEIRESSAFTIDASDTLEDKANALDIKANLKLSFMGGLIQVSGAAKYLDDRTSSFCQERVTMKYSCTTSFESLSMNHLGKGNIKHTEVFDHGNATHVVTGITYGANAFFVFDKMHSSSTSKRDASGELHAMVKSLPSIQIEGDAELKMSEEEKKKANTFKCQFYGDFKPWINPTTYQDAVRLYKDLPQQLGKNNEKAVPVTVWLYPLENLDSKASKLVRDISSNLVNKTEMVLENLHQYEMKCNDLIASGACQNFSQVKSDIFLFKELMQEYKISFQNKILPILPKIRGGGAEESELASVLKQNEESVFSRKQLSKSLESKESEVKVLSGYLKGMEGIPFASSQADMNAEIMDPSNKYVVAFTMVQPEIDPVIESMQAYLKDQYVDTSTVKAKKKEQSSKSMVQNARAFKDFWSANQDNASTKFIITLGMSDVHETSGFICVYKDGEVVSKDFQPPNKGGPPRSSLTRHNSLTLTWTEPNHGLEHVTGYELKYRRVGSSDQPVINISNKSNVFTLADLKSATPYEIKIRATCEYGFGPYTPWSDPIITLPCSPPGKPNVWQTSAIGVGLEWSRPDYISENIKIIQFQISHKLLDGKEWTTVKYIDASQTSTELEITPNTSHIFKVLADCGMASKSDYSEASEPVYMKAENKDILKARLKARAKRLGTAENPSIYELNQKEIVARPNDRIRKCELGMPKPVVPEKVIMVVGATGSGKTTLINGMVNYVLGVNWKDEFRFKLIADEGQTNQAKSVTSWVTSYTLYHQDGFQVPYTLTIIDTPGFGDTAGIIKDKEITEQIRNFFTTKGIGGIDHLDAVGFVAQSSLPRLTPTQKYVFDSILSLFGKDIGDNIFMMLTFADGQRPPVLDGIKEADVPYQKFFKFNNSALFACNTKTVDTEDSDSEEEKDEGDGNFDQMFWKMGAKSFKDFLKHLNKVESKTLVLTKDVLNERNHLEVYVQGIQMDVQRGLNKLEQLQKEVRVVTEHQADIDKNKDFTYTVTEETVELGPIDPGTYTTNCLTCKHTCHYPCMIKDDGNKARCAAMESGYSSFLKLLGNTAAAPGAEGSSKRGYCTVCPQRCHWQMHKNLPHKYNVKREVVTKTAADLKARYEDAQGKKLSAEQLITQIAEEFEAIQLRVIGQTDDIRASLQRLQEIALKPNPLSTVEYIDILISSEENEAHPGWQERVEQYRAVRKQVEYMKKLAEEGHDPFKKYKEKIAEEKKSGKGGVWSKIVDSKLNPMNWNMFKKESKKSGQLAITYNHTGTAI